jgi:DNA-binding IclR family transcriptional regulator
MLEQDPLSRRYRMGATVLRWAAIREASMPRKASALGPLRVVAEATGELAHVTILDGTRLMNLANHDPARHGTRVVIDVLEMPMNATASGHAVLAFARPELLGQVAGGFQSYTSKTITDSATLDAALSEARQTGFGTSNQGFETGVMGIAAPVFDAAQYAIGAISVASVAGRMTAELEATIKTELIAAARFLTNQWGGAVPASLDLIWQDHLAKSQASHQQTKETV